MVIKLVLFSTNGKTFANNSIALSANYCLMRIASLSTQKRKIKQELLKNL